MEGDFVRIAPHAIRKLSFTLHRAWRTQTDAPTHMADGGSGLRSFRQARISPHAAPFLRHAHGGKRGGPAHGADHPGPRGHFHYAGVHAFGPGPLAHRVSEASSAGEGEVRILHVENK